jgi:hypothetical protein
MNLARFRWLHGWRLVLLIVLGLLVVFIVFFSAFGEGKGEPTRPSARAQLEPAP